MDYPDCTLIIPAPSYTVFRLHARRLAAKSLFLRGLLSGVSALDLVHPSHIPFHIPRSRLPCLLSSPPSHHVLFLPVPDPSSIQSLFHWMYIGDTCHLENALDNGHVQWQGLARNVEYLGLPLDIKVFLGRWYRDRCLPTHTPYHDGPLCDSDESEPDSECDGYHSPCTNDDIQSDKVHRGRSPDVKPLVKLCGRLCLCTT